MRVWNRARLVATAAALALLASIAVPAPSAGGQRGWAGAVRRGGDDRFGGRRAPRGYQEPAFARGYGDGYASGVADGRGRGRYDPVRHKDYRDADQGYVNTYGSRDAYRNNYRAGFRQGYEDGYRDSTR